MTATYSWKINSIDTAKSEDGMSEADIQAALAQRIADDRDPPVVQKLPAAW